MSDKRLFDIWAWSQIEAAADGSLDAESRKRMAEAQDRDERLRAAVARARTLRDALRASGRERPPRGLLGTLLGIPQRHPRVSAARLTARGSIWVTAGGAVAAATLSAIVVLSVPSVSPPPVASQSTVSQPLASQPVAPVGPVGSDSPATHPISPMLPEISAAQDLVVALAYLNKSAAVTGREVGAAINGGLTAAFTVSRDSLSRRPD